MRIVQTHTKPASFSCFFTKNTRGVGLQSSFYLGWVFSSTLFSPLATSFLLFAGNRLLFHLLFFIPRNDLHRMRSPEERKGGKKEDYLPLPTADAPLYSLFFCGKIRRASIIVSPFLNGRKGEEEDFPLLWRAFVPIPFVNSHVFTCP